VFIAIHLDLDEAEFWQQYESANECVIATALCQSGRPPPKTLPCPSVMRRLNPPRLREARLGPRREMGTCGPTNFGS
jgi:hypothetical protein